MTMIHHDARDYKTAVSEAAVSFQKRLEERIHASVPRVTRVIEQVQSDVPDDGIVLGRALQFAVTPETKELAVFMAGDKAISPTRPLLTIHKNAIGQLAEKAKIPNVRSFMTDLTARGDWGKNLVAHNLNEIYHHMNGERYLMRSVRGELRGFLSDQYRRLDSRPLMDAFVDAIQKYGARPMDGFALETKIRVRAYLPMVFEPFPGELMAFGAELGDSDFGDGALTLSGIVERMWCTNLATTEDVLTKVHIGKRLSDNVRFSDETYALDTKAMASAVSDMAGHVLGTDAVNGYCDLVKRANEEKVDAHSITTWCKKHLNKTEGEKVIEKFASPEIEMLPPGQTTWRWSNCLSWLAVETVDEEHKLELQDLAGRILRPLAQKA